MMNGRGQSDGCIVPTKFPNKPKGAEGMEGRRPAKGNERQGRISRTQGRSNDMYQDLEHIRLAVSQRASVRPKARAGCGNSARPVL